MPGYLHSFEWMRTLWPLLVVAGLVSLAVWLGYLIATAEGPRRSPAGKAATTRHAAASGGDGSHRLDVGDGSASKALLVISDGGDNHSRYTTKEVENVVRESDVLIYAIGVFSGDGVNEDPWLLNKIAEQTGARMFEANSFELPDIAKKIGIELRNRYVVGYSPSNQQHDGRYHTVEVRVIPPRGLPKLTPHWRKGYYAPMD